MRKIIFLDPLLCIANEPHRLGRDVIQPAHEINHGPVRRRVQSIDREIPPLGIHLPVAPERHLRPPPVMV